MEYIVCFLFHWDFTYKDMNFTQCFSIPAIQISSSNIVQKILRYTISCDIFYSVLGIHYFLIKSITSACALGTSSVQSVLGKPSNLHASIIHHIQKSESQKSSHFVHSSLIISTINFASKKKKN